MDNKHHPDPVGRIDLTDMELEETSGGTTGWVCVTLTITLSVCTPTGTSCGSCAWGTRGCC